MKNNSKNNKEEKSKVKKVVKIVILIVVIILIALLIKFAIKVKENGGGATGIISAVVGVDEETLKNLPEIYCVLLGQSQNLTDTIMLASYNPKNQEASLLTIPRDTFIGKNKNTATPWDKINALCQYEHPEKTVAAVSELTGIEVTNYCLIDTKALVDVVNLIGGVYFDVPIDMKYTDRKQGLYIDLKAGYQLLDGEDAEGVLRFRHNQDGTTYPEEYGSEDLGRSRTQRAFLTQLAKQMLKPENIFKIKGFLDIFYENVNTNVSISDIKDYLPHAVKFNTDDIKTGIIPGKSQLCNGYYVYLHDKEGTAEVVEELFGNSESKDEDVLEENSSVEKETTENLEKNITIELLNGTDNENALYNVKNKLETNGYEIIKTSKTNLTSKTTIINRVNVEEEKIEELEDLMGIGFVSSGKSDKDIDITIIIGNDY